MVLGGFGGVSQFLFMGSSLGALCRCFGVVLGELGNFPLWGVNFGHCVFSLGSFLGN